MEKFVARLKTFDYKVWSLLGTCLLTIAVFIYFIIGMSISLAKGLTLFGQQSYDTLMLIIFIVIFFALTAIFIHNLLFKNHNPQFDNTIAHQNKIDSEAKSKVKTELEKKKEIISAEKIDEEK